MSDETNNKYSFSAPPSTIWNLINSMGLGIVWGSAGHLGYGFPTTRVLYSAAAAVGFTLGFINLLQQISTMNTKEGEPCKTWEEAIWLYFQDKHFLTTGLTTLKAYIMVTGWTGGYELVTKQFATNSFRDMLLRALGGASFSNIEPVATKETSNIIQHDLKKCVKKCLKKNEIPESWREFFERHAQSLRMLPPSFSTSMLATFLIDLKLASFFETKMNMRKVLAALLDIGIFTSLCTASFYYINRFTQYTIDNYYYFFPITQNPEPGISIDRSYLQDESINQTKEVMPIKIENNEIEKETPHVKIVDEPPKEETDGYFGKFQCGIQ